MMAFVLANYGKIEIHSPPPPLLAKNSSRSPRLSEYQTERVKIEWHSTAAFFFAFSFPS